MVGNPRLIERLRMVMFPYTVTAVSQMTAMLALQEPYRHIQSARILKKNREKLFEQLQKLSPDVVVYPSQTNFHLLAFPELNAREVAKELLEHGILVRTFPENTLLKDALRVTVSTYKHNRRFVDSLKEVIFDLKNS